MGPEDNRVCGMGKAWKRDLASLVLLSNSAPPLCEPYQKKAGGVRTGFFQCG